MTMLSKVKVSSPGSRRIHRFAYLTMETGTARVDNRGRHGPPLHRNQPLLPA